MGLSFTDQKNKAKENGSRQDRLLKAYLCYNLAASPFADGDHSLEKGYPA
ncbi:hypothetical protein [Pedobacter sp. GSP4]